MLTVKGWSSFQSYKDRKPPWIRLHKSLVDDFEFQMMSSDARAILPMLWLLASEDRDPKSGNIPYSMEQIAFRLRQPVKIVVAAVEECIAAGFLQSDRPCNESVTKPLQIRTQTVTPETETETETEAEKHIVDFEILWEAYPQKQGKKEALRHFKASVKTREQSDQILLALAKYKDHLDANSWKRPMNGSTWFNNWQDWVDFVEPKQGNGNGRKSSARMGIETVLGVNDEPQVDRTTDSRQSGRATVSSPSLLTRS